jgi:hypothetical protein
VSKELFQALKQKFFKISQMALLTKYKFIGSAKTVKEELQNF